MSRRPSNKKRGKKVLPELRLSTFTPSRVQSLKEQIKDSYESGVGISGTEFSRILFGYQQALDRYENTALKHFGMVATRDPKGHLFMIKKEEAGSSKYPLSSNVFSYSGVPSSSSASISSDDSSSTSSSSSLNAEISQTFSVLAEACAKLSKLYLQKNN